MGLHSETTIGPKCSCARIVGSISYAHVISLPHELHQLLDANYPFKDLHSIRSSLSEAMFISMYVMPCHICPRLVYTVLFFQLIRNKISCNYICCFYFVYESCSELSRNRNQIKSYNKRNYKWTLSGDSSNCIFICKKYYT